MGVGAADSSFSVITVLRCRSVGAVALESERSRCAARTRGAPVPQHVVRSRRLDDFRPACAVLKTTVHYLRANCRHARRPCPCEDLAPWLAMRKIVR